MSRTQQFQRRPDRPGPQFGLYFEPQEGDTLMNLIGELRESGYSGVVSADEHGRLAFARNDESIHFAGGTRVGKTAHAKLSALTAPGPLIILATRNDLADSVAPVREAVAERYGGHVLQIDPANMFSGSYRPAKVDILAGCDAYSVAKRRATSLLRGIEGSDSAHWRNKAISAVAPLLYTMAISRDTDANDSYDPVAEMRSIFAELDLVPHDPYSEMNLTVEVPDETLKTLREEISAILQQEEAKQRQVSLDYRDANNLPATIALQDWDTGTNPKTMGDRERPSVIGCVMMALGQSLWAPDLESEPAQLLDPNEFIQSSGTLICTVPPEDMASLSTAISILMDQVLRARKEFVDRMGGPQNAGPPLVVVADEAPMLLADLTSLSVNGGGSGIQLVSISHGAHENETHQGAGARTLETAAGHVMLFPGADHPDYVEQIAKRFPNELVTTYTYNATEEAGRFPDPAYASPRDLQDERIFYELVMQSAEHFGVDFRWAEDEALQRIAAKRIQSNKSKIRAVSDERRAEAPTRIALNRRRAIQDELFAFTMRTERTREVPLYELAEVISPPPGHAFHFNARGDGLVPAAPMHRIPWITDQIRELERTQLDDQQAARGANGPHLVLVRNSGGLTPGRDL